eukprot:539284_1
MSSNTAVSNSHSEGFTMVFIDFDDTLIPTSIRQKLVDLCKVDIFELLWSTEMKKLQYSIIRSLEKIRYHIRASNGSLTNEVRFCVVSNCLQKWLDFMFIPKHRQSPAKLPVLGKYFKVNKINVISAKKATFSFCQKKFGDEMANDMISDKNSDTNISHWMLKYTTFSRQIIEYKKELEMKCKRIISIGDGSSELWALNHYSSAFGIESLHINFIRCPTIQQIRCQWKYLANHMNKLIIKTPRYDVINKRLQTPSYDMKYQVKSDHFYIFYLNEKLEADNNKHCTGKSDQLNGIATYFDLFIRYLEECTESFRSRYESTVCQQIINKITADNNSSHKAS